MSKLSALLLVLALAAAGVFAARRLGRAEPESDRLVLYGNVDFRQAELAFDGSERIVALFAEEGERVTAGQVLGRMDSSALAAQVAEAEAALAGERASVERLENGTRPEEIAQARARVQAAEAELARARQQHVRLSGIADRLDGRAVSRQDVEAAEAELHSAEARLEVERRALELALAGPRSEDVAEARARERASAARLARLSQELADAELRAPTDGVVQARLMEVGEMASPLRPVYALAATDPKWVRAYVSGPDLGRVRPGDRARVTTDSFPERAFEGWVGFLSPVAEFTPKTVQTEELRTSLVYEVRIHVTDPRDELRRGMPATVTLQPGATGATGAREAQPGGASADGAGAAAESAAQ